jgi:hypothetical protein
MSQATPTPPTAPTAPIIMKGGSKEHISDIIKKYSKPIEIYIVTILTLAIVFVKQIPVEIRSQAGSILGRLFLFFTTLYIADKYYWTDGLLMGILTLLLLSLSPRKTAEGFMDDTDTNIEIVQGKRKWWVEKVLKENPVAIQDKTVRTKAVQDGSNGSSSTSSSK